MTANNPSGPFSWKEEYSLDLELIDTHHKKFIDILNNLHRVISGKPGREEISDIFFSLVYYAENHLVNEEIYLKEFGYPHFSRHKESHNNFIERVIKFQEDFRKGKENVCEDMYEFLKNWFENHILKYDRDAISSIREKEKRK